MKRLVCFEREGGTGWGWVYTYDGTNYESSEDNNFETLGEAIAAASEWVAVVLPRIEERREILERE